MFITFEGCEGVGKTTQLKFMAELLQKAGIEVLITREPGGTQMGEEIRNILLAHRHEKVAPMTELLLMFAARAQHVEAIIKPALEQKKWVLCDRFIDATFAYQGGGRGIPDILISKLTEIVLNNFKPDQTLLFDAPIEIGLERVKIRKEGQDRIEKEKMDFFERVRNAYLARAKDSSHYTIINAAQSLSDVQQQITLFTKKLLNHATV